MSNSPIPIRFNSYKGERYVCVSDLANYLDAEADVGRNSSDDAKRGISIFCVLLADTLVRLSRVS